VARRTWTTTDEPVATGDLFTALGMHLETEARARDLAIIRMLASALESRGRPDDHAGRVARRALAVLREITGGSPDPEIEYGYVLHDVGQVTVPESVLLKAGPLEPDELELVHGHAEAGVELVRALGLGRPAVDVIRHHHERWDGSGYPTRIAGERIPLHVRVFSVVDAYDSMRGARPYRKPMDHDCATADLRRQSGTQFDPACVDAFVRVARAQGWDAGRKR
jgi:ribonuclease P protein subunit RPR2